MLRKLFQYQFVPGREEIPADPGGYYCYTPPGDGYWETRCSNVELPINGSVPVPAGATLTVVRNDKGEVIRVYCTVCASVWVQTGAAKPPVCSYVPPRAYQPASPPRIDVTATTGWDSGANSGVAQGGNCEAVLTMGLVVGAYVGFTQNLDDVAAINRYSHALYFHQRAGRPVFRIVEEGEARSPDMDYSSIDVFTIRRVAGIVSYWQNDTNILDSTLTSDGDINVGSALYVSGDMIP